MTELSTYVEILQDGLKNKIIILSNIIKLNTIQEELLSEEKLNIEKYDDTVDKKQVLIGDLNRLDDGFEATYDRVRIEFESRKNEFKQEIELMRADISTIMDYSVTIQASEARNKIKVDEYFKGERVKIGKKRITSKAAHDYYKASSKANYVDPVVMDKKK